MLRTLPAKAACCAAMSSDVMPRPPGISSPFSSSRLFRQAALGLRFRSVKKNKIWLKLKCQKNSKSELLLLVYHIMFYTWVKIIFFKVGNWGQDELTDVVFEAPFGYLVAISLCWKLEWTNTFSKKITILFKQDKNWMHLPHVGIALKTSLFTGLW